MSPAFSKTVGLEHGRDSGAADAGFRASRRPRHLLLERERLANSAEDVLQFENRYLHKDGSWRVLSWRSVLYEGGLFFSTARDVTGAREAERGVVAAKDAFLATMSHEIRTPLNGLLGMLELLSLWQLDGEQGETLEIARDSGRSLVRIIDDILDFGKIAAGKLEIRAAPCRFEQLLRRTANTFLAVASAKDLTLKHSVDARISPSLLADSLRVAQILNNLVSNALKFTAEGLRGSTGRATSAGEWHRHGEAFGRRTPALAWSQKCNSACSSRSNRRARSTAGLYGGTGFGLSISRRLAEMMGSTIEVKSALGEGATMSVTLTLPISETAPAELESKATAAVLPLLLSRATWRWPIGACGGRPFDQSHLAGTPSRGAGASGGDRRRR